MPRVSHWQELGIETKILEVLASVPQYDPTHHLGRPFLTAYQLAIEFAIRHPDEAARLGPIGGAGTGQHSSLSQYLAHELSTRIASGELSQVEGGFLSNQHLNDINFRHQGSLIHSSLTGSQYPLSMFRLR